MPPTASITASAGAAAEAMPAVHGIPTNQDGKGATFGAFFRERIAVPDTQRSGEEAGPVGGSRRQSQVGKNEGAPSDEKPGAGVAESLMNAVTGAVTSLDAKAEDGGSSTAGVGELAAGGKGTSIETSVQMGSLQNGAVSGVSGGPALAQNLLAGQVVQEEAKPASSGSDKKRAEAATAGQVSQKKSKLAEEKSMVLLAGGILPQPAIAFGVAAVQSKTGAVPAAEGAGVETVITATGGEELRKSRATPVESAFAAGSPTQARAASEATGTDAQGDTSMLAKGASAKVGDASGVLTGKEVGASSEAASGQFHADGVASSGANRHGATFIETSPSKPVAADATSLAITQHIGHGNSTERGATSQSSPGNFTTNPIQGTAAGTGRVTLTSFDRMDQGASPVVLHAGAQRVEVGVHDPQLGWVEIRAQNTAGQVDARLVASSSQTHSALAAQLPAMAQYLQERDVRVGTIAVHSPGTPMGGNGAGAQGGSSQGSSSGGQPFRGNHSVAAVKGISAGRAVEVSSAGMSHTSEDTLPVTVNYISVRA